MRRNPTHRWTIGLTSLTKISSLNCRHVGFQDSSVWEDYIWRYNAMQLVLLWRKVIRKISNLNRTDTLDLEWRYGNIMDQRKVLRYLTHISKLGRGGWPNWRTANKRGEVRSSLWKFLRSKIFSFHLQISLNFLSYSDFSRRCCRIPLFQSDLQAWPTELRKKYTHCGTCKIFGQVLLEIVNWKYHWLVDHR